MRGWIKLSTVPHKDYWEDKPSRPVVIRVADISSFVECDEGTEIDMSSGMTIPVTEAISEVLTKIREA